MKFLADLRKYEAENPKAAPGAAAPANAAEAQVAEAKAAADQLGAQPGDAKPGETKPGEAKPGEAKPAAEADANVTPKQLADLLDARPELKAAIEADPEAKGQLFGMARKLAAADEVLKIVPTKADAEFMAQHATEMVTLKTASMRLADNPESAPQVLEMLDQQFAIVDGDGKPVLDTAGNPTYASDRKPFLDAVVSRELGGFKKDYGAEMNQLKAKLASGVYPNDAAKQMDQQRLDSLEYALTAIEVVDMLRSGEYFKPEMPEIPADASAEFKAWAESERKRIADEAAALDAKKQGAGKEAKAAERAQFQGAVRSDMGSSAGKMISERLREAVESGTYIPEFYLQEKWTDPVTGKPSNTAAIAARLFMQFENELLRPGSRSMLEITQHELLPPNEQTRALRKAWYDRKAAEIIPDLVRAEVDRIQGLVKMDKTRQAERSGARAAAAQPEPASAGSSLPQGATEAQMRDKAEELAKKDPRFAAASPGDKQAMIITQLHRLRR